MFKKGALYGASLDVADIPSSEREVLPKLCGWIFTTPLIRLPTDSSGRKNWLRLLHHYHYRPQNRTKQDSKGGTSPLNTSFFLSNNYFVVESRWS